jgi:arylsulfatase A-like enzyme
MDSQVGRMLDALDAAGLTSNTIVVLWSDNGWHIGEKLITGKTTLWDRSTHVPLLFAGPGVSRGGTFQQPVELLDIYPTLVELCALPPKKGLEGHSLLRQLKDVKAVRSWPALTTHNVGNHAIRSARWRYIRYANGSEELYDCRADPNEWTNLAKDPAHAEVLREHARWLPAVNAPPVPGSASRVLWQKDGVWLWEGQPIRPEEKEE